MADTRERREVARQADLDALTRLVIANDDLERLEAAINAFNIFEALGVARQELRHSDFLAFLLDPNQPHGLGDRFLKRFLQRALAESPGPIDVTPVEIELLELDQMVPYRERQNIDILLLDRENQIAVIIENKVGSGEHSEQLQRYRKTITRQYPGWKIIPVFLTPDGEEPSDESYLTIDYGVVAEIVVHLGETLRSSLEPEVFGLLHHYARLLGRYVVEESEIAELCQRIYAKHKRAIDLIVEHRPGEIEVLKEFLQDLVHATEGLIENDDPRSGVRFLPESWDRPALRHADGWTATNRILLLEFVIRPKRVDLVLQLGPGEPSLRQRIIDAARAAGPPFRIPPKPGPKWTRFYSLPVLSKRDSASLTLDEQQDRIRQVWGAFTNTTLPAMVAKLDLPYAEPEPGDSGSAVPSAFVLEQVQEIDAL